MKVLPFKIPKPNNDALIYQEDHQKIFYDKFHQHEEIQLSYIAEGEGTLVVGDTINDFKKDDVLVIGSYVPHVFKSDKGSKKKSLMLTLFFTKDSFGDAFFEIDDLKKLSPFFKRAEHGFKANSHKQKLMSHFLKLKTQSKFQRFVTFIKLLDILSKSKHQRLSSYKYDKHYSDTEGRRMSAVMEYTINNFQNTIYLDDIAKVAAMTKNAFCKYFKKRTNKTYIQFLNELRIEHAIKLLNQDKDSSIAEIAEKSGFSNISNFNRQFKKFKSQLPSELKNSTL